MGKFVVRAVHVDADGSETLLGPVFELGRSLSCQETRSCCMWWSTPWTNRAAPVGRHTIIGGVARPEEMASGND